MDLTSDELWTTTPALRKRLDLDRQVSRSVIEGWRMEGLKSRATCEKIVGGWYNVALSAQFDGQVWP